MSRPAAVEDVLRDLAPVVLGAVVRRYGDFAAAEDAVQEALIAAATQWPTEGIPANARGWLVTVATRRMSDQIRSEVARRRREETALTLQPPPADPPGALADQDDTLALLFLCCHPALSPGASIPLTLRAVGGLTTAEIARAFLLPEATIAQRISRAKQRVKAAGSTFSMPAPAELPQRLRLVQQVLYLVFNEGYSTSAGPALTRADLSGEAIRLSRSLYRLRPEDAETGGLLALMLLIEARRPARIGPAGELIPLDEQDRGRWDQGLVAEGISLLELSLARGTTGPYQLQAAVNALHDQAGSWSETDWPQILALYQVLDRLAPSPMVTLSKAVAVAMVAGPAAGLAALDPVAETLAGSHRLAAVRGHLHEMAGDPELAESSYREAAARTTSLPERHYLTMRAGRLHAR